MAAHYQRKGKREKNAKAIISKEGREQLVLAEYAKRLLLLFGAQAGRRCLIKRGEETRYHLSEKAVSPFRVQKGGR